MKRSDMLRLMLESYCKDVPYHDDGGLQLQWKLIRLLEDMEAAGMLPPREYEIKGEHVVKPFLVSAWEPEDDE